MKLTSGTTTFDYEPADAFTGNGKVKISTGEGSSIAVNGEDLLRFMVSAYVLPLRQAREEKKNWQDVLLG